MKTHRLCARTALVLFASLPAAAGVAQTRVPTLRRSSPPTSPGESARSCCSADVLDGDLTDKSAFERIADALPEDERAAYRERLADFLSPQALAGATDADLARRSDWFGWYFLRAMGWSIPRPDTYPAMRWAGGCAVVGAFIGLGERGDATGDLASVRARTLVLHAGSDLTPPAASQAYATAIPGAGFHVIPATAHFFRSAASETAARIEAFLQAGS